MTTSPTKQKNLTDEKHNTEATAKETANMKAEAGCSPQASTVCID